MAGFTQNKDLAGEFQFHIGSGIGKRIRRANNDARVITLQLDGDELDAALWGLENWRPNRSNTVEEIDTEVVKNNVFLALLRTMAGADARNGLIDFEEMMETNGWVIMKKVD